MLPHSNLVVNATAQSIEKSFFMCHNNELQGVGHCLKLYTQLNQWATELINIFELSNNGKESSSEEISKIASDIIGLKIAIEKGTSQVLSKINHITHQYSCFVDTQSPMDPTRESNGLIEKLEIVKKKMAILQNVHKPIQKRIKFYSDLQLEMNKIQ